MTTLFTYYNDLIIDYKTQLSGLKKQLFAFSMLRLTIFFLAALGGYYTFRNTQLVLAIILVTLILFLFLISKYSDLQYKRDKVLALIKINETEIDILNRKFNHLPSGENFKNSNHYFSQDIDLFGKASFYQYCNRTALEQGAKKLAAIFTENSIDGIEEKQIAIKELSGKTTWRQEFTAIAKLVKTDVSYTAIVNWLKEYTAFVPKVMKWLPLIFSSISTLLFTLCYFQLISTSILMVWFLAGALTTSKYLKKTNKLSLHVSQVQSTFHQYQKLILEIENENFTSELLNHKKNKIKTKKIKTSEILQEFSNLLSALDRRNNIILAIITNGFFLSDLKQAYKIENWIQQNGSEVENWFNTIAFFDAYNSLGNYSFNHPEYTFTTITSNSNTTLNSNKISHPLLDPNTCVTNNVKIQNEDFFIITGANMAGKSTFLRTISLQIVMSNMGLPICAKNTSYSPIKLITSMRTTDSLADDESYFFSELKRLKFIVDKIKTDQYFIVLDEILKGTNSSDKAIGSLKFVEKLVASKSTGIIATHDLSLCEIAHKLPQVKNYYFDAEIINNELYFDYKFKNGICQNMNASFLLKKMEII